MFQRNAKKMLDTRELKIFGMKFWLMFLISIQFAQVGRDIKVVSRDINPVSIRKIAKWIKWLCYNIKYDKILSWNIAYGLDKNIAFYYSNSVDECIQFRNV